MANTYCLMSNLFTVTSGHRIYQTYYQWIPFFLGLQAASFTVGHHLWKSTRGHHLETLVHHFEKGRVDLRFIKTRSFFWSIKLIMCEVINTVNIFVQIYLTDVFLKGKFTFYGFEWLAKGDDILDDVFPKRAKCTFYTTGPSGSKQVHDSLCLLFHNIYNDKLFLIIWFLHIIVLNLSICLNLWRTISFVITQRIYLKFSLIFQIGLTPLRPYLFKELLTIRGLSHCDSLFISYALSNLSNDDVLRVIIILSNKINNHGLDLEEIQMNEPENPIQVSLEPKIMKLKNINYEPQASTSAEKY